MREVPSGASGRQRLSMAPLVSALIAAAALGGTAWAGEGALLTRGAAPAQERAAAAEAVREALVASGWQLSRRQLSEREAEALSGCLRNDQPWRCIAAVLKDKAIDQLAIVSVDPRKTADGAPTTVVTTRIVVASRDLAYGDEQYCERCSPEKLEAAAAAVTTKVLERVYLASNRTSLELKTTPAGALVVMDGNVMGFSDLSFSLLPGRHNLKLTLSGFQELHRVLDLVDGQAAEVNVTLQPEEPAAVPARPAPSTAALLRQSGEEDDSGAPRWRAPAILGGAGAALLATGGIFLYTGRDQPRGELQEARNLSTPGVVCLALGGAAVAGGIGLYVWRRAVARPRTAPAATSPAASTSVSALPLPGGLAAAFATRF